MVCIAAFIVLVVIGIFAALISIFNRDFGKKYLSLLKKSFHCFGKRVRLQKCDTNFADDIKTTLLKKVVIKNPKLVKPLSIVIEVASALIILVSAWSLIEVTKGGLALWVFGTCNVSQPSNCALGAESCSIDEDNLNWFTEWGEIFSNIPDRLKAWDAEAIVKDSDLTLAYTLGNSSAAAKDAALALVDPGCSVCMQSYKNLQSSADFRATHKIYVVIYPIKNPNGSYRFANSALIARYMLATNKVVGSSEYSEKILGRIFTEFNGQGINYQSVFNSSDLSASAAEELLLSWLKEWGLSADQAAKVKSLAASEEIQQILDQNTAIIDQQIKPKGIPTFIYDGKKHLGLFKVQ